MGPATARLFDAMAEDYDALEPWYEHLYAVLHPILLDALAADRHGGPGHGPARRRRALDAGCGTGFQTALLEHLGYATHGVDVAGRLLAIARRRLVSPTLALAGVEALPYRDESFDAVACCGSTLSFVDDPAAALHELARVLKPGGRVLLELEHRGSLDLAWTLLSALGGDFLGYGLKPAAAWRQLARRPREGCTIPYPGYGRLRLFTRPELRSMLGAAALEPRRWWGIHSITNVIPSTVLHREKLGPFMAALYARLRTIDTRLGPSRLAQHLANSLVVLAEKRPPKPVMDPPRRRRGSTSPHATDRVWPP
jgi:SAM-dependent methyltransferase